ncbi:MAG: serine hydroxymethyltransferase [Cyanobacteriota bacterium]
MNLEIIRKTDPEIAEVILNELTRQQTNIELIASENFTSEAVLYAMGSVLTNKYAEGLPKKRYYGGCEFVDDAENLARERAKKLFGAEHANVQPHSGAQANMAIMLATCKPGDTIMGMDLSCGGHLTHGSPVNFSGLFFNVVAYKVHPETGRIDFDEVERLAKEHKPRVIISGYSNYPRIIDFEKFQEIAKSVGAYHLADIAHIAGLVATGYHPSPVGVADFVTTTTHKTLRGPRGGLILTSKENSKMIDKALFPGTQGGPLMHVIAAKAVAFKEALEPEFKDYCGQIIKNAKTFADKMMSNGLEIVSGGTDNHLMTLNTTNLDMTGKDASNILESVNITANKNTIPNDPRSPFITSGVRMGTPAATTRGFKENHMEQVADIITRVLRNSKDEALLLKAKNEVIQLCKECPLYPDILNNQTVIAK